MSLVLSILFGDNNAMLNTKKMSFPFDATIFDILKAIGERQPEGTNMEDYGLFQPLNKKYEKGSWMIPKRTIESYGLVTGDELWFRKRNQIVAVLLPDGSIKKMMLDVCQTVKNLVAAIAEKLSLHHAEAFGLQIKGTDKFLKMKATLYEVATPADVITLKKRHFIQEGELNRDDPMLLHLSYIQAHDNIVKGLYPCNKDEIIRFGQYNAMIDMGKCDETKKVNSIHQKIKEFVPEHYQKKEIEKEIFARWKGMNAMTPIDAKYKYLQLCMTLRSYGQNIYQGGIEPKGVIQSEDPKKKKLTQTLMAFSPIEIKLMTLDHKVLASEPYENLKSWKFSNETITFNFGKHNNGEVIVFYTSEGEDIFSLVQGYIEIITLKAQKIIEDDADNEKAEEVKVVEKKKKAAVTQRSMLTRIAPQAVLATDAAIAVATSDVYQATKEYALGLNFAVDINQKAVSNDDLWRNQLRLQSDNLLGLLKPLTESFRTGNKLTDEEIKKIGFFIDGIRNAVLSGQNAVMDKDIFEIMANNLMDACNEYFDICSALEKDPNNVSLLRAMADCEARIKMCVEALNACASGLIMDLDQEVIYELASSIAANIDLSCEYVKEQNCPGMEEAILEAQNDARMIIYGAQSMGLSLGSENCQTLFKDLLARCKNSSVNLLEKSGLKGQPMGGPLEIDIDDICNDLQILDEFCDEVKDDIIDKRNKYLESIGFMLQSVNHLSTLPHVRVEDVQKTALEIKKDLPIIVKYCKEYTANPEIDDAKRKFIIGHLKEMTTNSKPILTNADQTKFKNENVDDIRESAGLVGDSIRAILGDEIGEVIHNSIYTDSKKAAIACVKLAQLMKNRARNEKNAEHMRELLEAARRTAKIADKLVKPVENEQQYIDKTLEVQEEYKELAKELDLLYDKVEDGRIEMIEEKMNLDVLMKDLEENVFTFQKENMLYILHNATIDARVGAVELKKEIIGLECNAELVVEGIPEEAHEAALHEVEALAALREDLNTIGKFDFSNGEKVDALSKQTKKAIRALIRASKTAPKKNERKMLLDAAMKLSNEMQRLLQCCDDESLGLPNKMGEVQLECAQAEKQLINLLKVEDFELEMQTKHVEVTSEELEAEKKALERMKEVSQEVKEMHTEMMKEAEEKGKIAAESEDPKKIVEAEMQQAIVVMVGSSIGVLETSIQAQEELVYQLQDPNTAAGVHRDVEYAEELTAAVDDVLTTTVELRDKIKEDNVNSDELVKVADKVGKNVERVVVKARAGTRTKGKSNKYRELLDASKKLADSTKNLLELAKQVDEFDDTPVVVQMNLPPPPPPQPVVIEEEEDIETFGIDAYTLKEIEQQKKIFELEKKLEAAKKYKADLEEIAKKQNF